MFSRIGQDEREVLEYVPSSFKVIRHIRPKLSCRACETIVQPPMPSLPIERGRPGPGLLAQVLVAKFCDHTPLHRQAGIYAREGVELDRSTLADWVGRSVFLLDPLAEAIGRHVRAGQVLHADDTSGRPGAGARYGEDGVGVLARVGLERQAPDQILQVIVNSRQHRVGARLWRACAWVPVRRQVVMENCPPEKGARLMIDNHDDSDEIDL